MCQTVALTPGPGRVGDCLRAKEKTLSFFSFLDIRDRVSNFAIATSPDFQSCLQALTFVSVPERKTRTCREVFRVASDARTGWCPRELKKNSKSCGASKHPRPNTSRPVLRCCVKALAHCFMKTPLSCQPALPSRRELYWIDVFV